MEACGQPHRSGYTQQTLAEHRMEENIAKVSVSTATDLVKAGEALNNSWFRGHSSSNWGLESTLERDAERFAVPRTALWEREQTMLRLFKKRAHLHVNSQEYPNSEFEWFALIRHYGGPSRLLDVTSSYLVGAYFALVDSQPNRDAVIWAFRAGTIKVEDAVNYDELFRVDAPLGVVVADPARLNLRLSAQSGYFFVPGSVTTSLEDQVGITYQTDFKAKISVYRSVKHVATEIHHKIWKVVIPRSAHSEIFRFLSRCNVRTYLLFPGTDGLAISLREMMRGYA